MPLEDEFFELVIYVLRRAVLVGIDFVNYNRFLLLDLFLRK